MKKIRLYLDYIPEHLASRTFAIELFKQLHAEGVPCDMVVFGLERFAIPKFRIIEDPAELEGEELHAFMNKSIREFFISPRFDTEIANRWNHQLIQKRGDLFRDTSTISVNICDTSEIFREFSHDGLRAETAGSANHYQLPIFTQATETDDSFDALDRLAPLEMSKLAAQNVSLEEVSIVLTAISENELEASSVHQSKRLRDSNVMQHVKVS